MTTVVEPPRAAPTPPPARRPVRRSLLISGAVAAVAIVVLVVALARGGGGSSLQATLSVLQRAVEIRHGGTFVAAASGEHVAQGDGVRTDHTGEAQLDYPDGSLTRLGADTEFSLSELASRAGHRAYRFGLKVGQTWHRVSKLSGSENRYEVGTSNAVAAVRGTTFLVDCFVPNTCTITVIDGRVLVTTKTGRSVLLGPNQSVTISGAGDLGSVRLISLDELAANDPFVADNVRRDGLRPGGGPTPGGETTTTTSTPTVVSGIRTSSRGAGVNPITPAFTQGQQNPTGTPSGTTTSIPPSQPASTASVPAGPSAPPAGTTTTSSTAPTTSPGPTTTTVPRTTTTVPRTTTTVPRTTTTVPRTTTTVRRTTTTVPTGTTTTATTTTTTPPTGTTTTTTTTTTPPTGTTTTTTTTTSTTTTTTTTPTGSNSSMTAAASPNGVTAASDSATTAHDQSATVHVVGSKHNANTDTSSATSVGSPGHASAPSAGDPRTSITVVSSPPTAGVGTDRVTRPVSNRVATTTADAVSGLGDSGADRRRTSGVLPP